MRVVSISETGAETSAAMHARPMGPTSFTVAELTAAAVTRVSLATSLYRAAMAGMIAAAREVKDSGTLG